MIAGNYHEIWVDVGFFLLLFEFVLINVIC